MTLVFGQREFAQARRDDAEQASAQRRLRRAQAFEALHDARTAFRDDAGASADRDSDGLEDIAARLLAFLDTLEPRFDRLDAARDIAIAVGPEGRRVQRSGWDRAGLALVLAEGFQQLLDGPALAVLIAATRVETFA